MTRLRQSPSGPFIDQIAIATRDEPVVLGPGLSGLTLPDVVVNRGFEITEQPGPLGIGDITVITPTRAGFYRTEINATYTGALTTFFVSLVRLDDISIGLAASETATGQACSAASPAEPLEKGQGIFPLLNLGAAVTIQRAQFSIEIVQ